MERGAPRLQTEIADAIAVAQRQVIAADEAQRQVQRDLQHPVGPLVARADQRGRAYAEILPEHAEPEDERMAVRSASGEGHLCSAPELAVPGFRLKAVRSG